MSTSLGTGSSGAMPQKRGSGEKRARQEEASNDEGCGGQSSLGTGSKRRKECVAAKTSQAISPSQGSVAEAELLLPGPCLGTGSKWELRGACEASMAKMLQQVEVSEELELLRRQGMGLLKQALECSKHADVRFELDDGSRLVGAHRASLCCASESFKGMFSSGMKEEEQGLVRMRGVDASAVKALLEFVYLGRAGEECKMADGRELWVLAEMYDVQVARNWLMHEGITKDNLIAVFQFSQLPQGYRSDLASACTSFAMHGLQGVSNDNLAEIERETVKALVVALMRDLPEDGFGRRCVLDVFRFVERWWSCTGKWDRWSEEEIDDVMKSCDLGRLRNQELMDVVKPSGLVSMKQLVALYERRLINDNPFEGIYLPKCKYGKHESGLSEFESVGQIALRGTGANQVVAAVDSKKHRVVVFNVMTGKVVSVVGSKGTGPGNFGSPLGVAFAPSGEMFVSDKQQHKIHIFDVSGKYVRSFGNLGVAEGQLIIPHGLAFTPEGELVVADFGNNRVQIFRTDGTFVRCFGAGSFNCPIGVGVGDDGMIAVTDYSNARVQLYNSQGVFQKFIGSRGDGPGFFQTPYDICVASPGGEILVTDLTCGTVQIFGRDGKQIQTIGRGGRSNAEFRVPQGVAVDEEGKVFVGCVYLHCIQMLETTVPDNGDKHQAAAEVVEESNEDTVLA